MSMRMSLIYHSHILHNYVRTIKTKGQLFICLLSFDLVVVVFNFRLFLLSIIFFLVLFFRSLFLFLITLLLELVLLVGGSIGPNQPEVVKPFVSRDVGANGRFALPTNDAQFKLVVRVDNSNASSFELKDNGSGLSWLIMKAVAKL